MHLNYLAIFIASLAQFVFSAVWYTPIFGKMWGKIHGFESRSKEEQKEMMKGMGPLLAMQFVLTVVTTTVFAFLLQGPTIPFMPYLLALLFWLGFMAPTQVSAVLFGGTEPRFVLPKIFIMIGASLGCIFIAAAILTSM